MDGWMGWVSEVQYGTMAQERDQKVGGMRDSGLWWRVQWSPSSVTAGEGGGREGQATVYGRWMDGWVEVVAIG